MTLSPWQLQRQYLAAAVGIGAVETVPSVAEHPTRGRSTGQCSEAAAVVPVVGAPAVGAPPAQLSSEFRFLPPGGLFASWHFRRPCPSVAV